MFPDFRESQTKTIHLPEDDVTTVAAALEFMYSHEWNCFLGDELEQSTESDPVSYPDKEKIFYHRFFRGSDVTLSNVRKHLDQWVDVYIFADKYIVETLKVAVTKKFKTMTFYVDDKNKLAYIK